MNTLFPNQSFVVICNQCDFQAIIPVGEDLSSIEDHAIDKTGHVISLHINSISFAMKLLQETAL